MNILNVTTITEWRGGDKQMYTIYKLLENTTGIRQFILCPEKSELAKMCKEDNSAYFTYNKNKLKLINATRAIVKICKKEHIDVIHLHDSSSLNAALMALPFIANTVKLVFSRKRDNPIKNKFLNRLKYTHPRIVKIISVSKAVEAIFYKVMPNRDRLLTIYDAIDVSRYADASNKFILHKEFNIDSETALIGNIAGLTRQKDIYTFIDTAKKVLQIKPGELKVKFIVIGTGEEKDNLIAYTKSLGLEQEVLFGGFRSNTEELLPEFDVFLMTSISEGLPLTIYEAFAGRIPVVSTDAGGIREVLETGKTGILANVKDINALAAGVLKILEDTTYANMIKENAYQLVKKGHDLDVLKQNYISFYKSL
jgi:glycosyltransferase involved in cell wall biosynthesis